MITEFLRYLNLELNRSQHTVIAYEADLRGFNEFMVKSGVPTGDSGFFIASEISTADIREWMIELSDAHVAPVSIRRKVQSLRAYFRFLIKKGIISSNPARAIPLPKVGRKLPVISTHEDISKAIENSHSTLEALILELLYGCGLRQAELIAINDPDINIHSRELKILGKGNKHRVIPLPQQLINRITEWREERDSIYPNLPEPKPLLATKRGRISSAYLYRVVHSALITSGAQKKSPHTLRHSFATQLLNGGADINSVKELLGHASLGATQIYTHVALSELSREWKKAHPRAKK